jgi:hypothetical protein
LRVVRHFRHSLLRLDSGRIAKMSEERTKRTWPWIAALVGLPVLYVASFGPACWLMTRGSLPIFPTAYPYWPLVVAANAAPSGVRKLVGRYSGNSPLGFKDMLTELALQYIDRGGQHGVPPWLTPAPPFW